MHPQSKMYITRVNHTFDFCDAYFPEVNMVEWEEIYFEQGEYDFYNCYNYSFHIYKRKTENK